MAGDLANRDQVNDALGSLDPKHRAVVVMHYFLGMPLTDVAAALRIPVGTAKSRLHYSLATMRASMAAELTPTGGSLAGGHPA
jgi:RNA polymerase sigma-70 factor (ECF subfamily)